MQSNNGSEPIVLDPTKAAFGPSDTLVTLGHTHFIGIGGAGMSVLAEMIHEEGVEVSGSDREANAKTDRLTALGIKISFGQRAENVAGAQTVVYSSAIKPDNPEIIAAAQAGARIVHRSDILALLMASKCAVSVAGAHGKTTTSSLISHILVNAGVEADAQNEASADARSDARNIEHRSSGEVHAAIGADESLNAAVRLADPSYAIGGSIQGPDGVAIDGGHAGSGDVLVAEADESDGSFEKYRPQFALITNAEADHLDHYGDAEHYQQAFVEYAGHAKGYVVMSIDDKGAQAIVRALPAEVAAKTICYTTDPSRDISQIVSVDGTHGSNVMHNGTAEATGIQNTAAVPAANSVTSPAGAAASAISGATASVASNPSSSSASCATSAANPAPLAAGTARPQLVRILSEQESVGDGTERFTIELPSGFAGFGEARRIPVTLRIPGIHNARNATAAIIVTTLLGMDPELAARTAATFRGASRRFEVNGVEDGVTVVDDYAHHPTEIAALLDAARRRYPDSTIRVLFQPHLFSRTKFFIKRFAAALAKADDVVIAPIYPARERQEDFPDITSQVVVDAAASLPHAPSEGWIAASQNLQSGAETLVRHSKPGDVLITVGAGDVTTMDDVMLDLLKARAGASR
ncbi:Mur ligase domain-containing protein [Bifidobacterium sp. ESL0728]|uniref:UDP-N-acetylmuramate--L-alanine ligase n=1 Tax=Bifidobacterium sp. ESL0728 TaxID=2983220 RepID=UPI0023F85111|nr:Mur ligase domain-containing protein [Bifidobacterium sp. ESL0728]WEV58531.1 Mur ligase domain-containing protein [Bifidobacterium sp. ESL0728]